MAERMFNMSDIKNTNEELTFIQPYLVMVNGGEEEVTAINENTTNEKIVVIKSLGNGAFAVKYPEGIMTQEIPND